MPPNRPHPRANAGFNLLEVMVGLLIASISTLVVMQVLLLFESQKRTTVSGDDAQNIGAIALYSLQRDIRQGGYGISATALLGCDVLLRDGVTLAAMAPVTINHASIPIGDANTDTLLVAYGNTLGSPEGSAISAQPSQTVYTVDLALAFTANDRVIATPMGRVNPCSGSDALRLDTVSSVNTTTEQVTVATGVTGMTNGRLYNLGQGPKVYAYAVRGGNLTVCDYMANDCSDGTKTSDSSVWVPIANNVVSLRAQYGRDTDTAMDGVLNLYNQTTPSDNSSTTFYCDWARISAVRLVLVARSTEPAKPCDSVNALSSCTTPSAPTWSGSNADNPTGSASTPVDLSSTTVPTGFSWHDFRYKTFESIVPIRNIAQVGVPSGC